MEGRTDGWIEQKETRAPIKGRDLEMGFDDLSTLFLSFSLRSGCCRLDVDGDQLSSGGFA